MEVSTPKTILRRRGVMIRRNSNDRLGTDAHSVLTAGPFIAVGDDKVEHLRKHVLAQFVLNPYLTCESISNMWNPAWDHCPICFSCFNREGILIHTEIGH